MSITAKRRAKRARNIIERQKAKPTQETGSLIKEIMRRTETVTIKEDAPYAAKREHMSKAPIVWLAGHKLIEKPQRDAAMLFARDWFDGGHTPNVTATMEPTIPGVATWSREDAIDAHSRFRWIQVRVSGDNWPVVEAVVLHEQPVLEWLEGLRANLCAAKAQQDGLRAKLAEAVSVRQTPEQRAKTKAIEDELASKTHEVNALIVAKCDKAVAMRRLREGLDELIMLRRAYWLEYGEDGIPEGEPMTEAAAVERRELLGV